MTGGRGVTGSTDFAASFRVVGDALSALRHLNLPPVFATITPGVYRVTRLQQPQRVASAADEYFRPCAT